MEIPFLTQINLAELTGAVTPVSSVALYAKADQNMYIKNSLGIEGMLWSSLNHGHGSGLNADLLDGNHATAFALSGHTHSYQPLDADLTAIAALTGSVGLLRKTAENTWEIDINSYAYQYHTHTSYVAIIGDTMSGNLSIHKSGSPVTAHYHLSTTYTANYATQAWFEASSYTNGGYALIKAIHTNNSIATEYNIISAAFPTLKALYIGDVNFNSVIFRVPNGVVGNISHILCSGTDGITYRVPVGDISGNGGTVTSIGMTVPTGLTVSPATITTSGTFAIAYTPGYSIPTTANQTNWNTAFGWGNHASAGYGLASALTTHANLTTTAHGLGASAFHPDSFFALASHTHPTYENQWSIIGSFITPTTGTLEVSTVGLRSGGVYIGDFEQDGYKGMYSLDNDNVIAVYNVGTETYKYARSAIEVVHTGTHPIISLISVENSLDYGSAAFEIDPETGMNFLIHVGANAQTSMVLNADGLTVAKLSGAGDRAVFADANGLLKIGSSSTQYWQLSGNILSPTNTNYSLSVNENYVYAGDLALRNQSEPDINFFRYRMSGGNQITLINGDVLGNISFYASDANGFAKGAGIQAIATGNHAEKEYPTSLQFYTSDVTDSNLLRMNIRETGLIEITKGLVVNYGQGTGTITLKNTGGTSAFIAHYNGQVAINQSTYPSNLNVGGSVSFKSRYITGANQTLGAEFMVYINAGATNLYLPSAASSGERFYFVVNSSASNVTLRVPSGDYLNNVLNGTFSIKGSGFTIIQQGASIGTLHWFAYELR